MHRLAALIFILSACTVFLSCSDSREAVSPKGSSNTKPDTQNLVRGNFIEPSTLDPHRAHANFEGDIMRDLLEGLVIASPGGGIETAVAERWENDRNRIFTFYLRKDARWSNGDPVVAEDFVYSWRRLAAPTTGSTCADFLTEAGVKNASAILLGQKSPQELGVVALDEQTLRVTLEHQNSLFVDMLSRTCSLPLHRPTLERFAEEWTRPGHFVGNGAFVLDDWIVNERLELQRNPFYHDAGKVQLDRVTYLPTSPATGELNRYYAGEIDITSGVPIDQQERLQRALPAEMRINPALNTAGWAINTRRSPFDNATLRRALAYAIDRELIANKAFGLGVRPAYTLSAVGDPTAPDGKNHWQYWSQEERESRARSLYAQAGYGPGNPLTINLQVLNNGNSPRLANAAAAMWKRVLGAEINLIRYEWKTLGDRLQLGDFDMSIYAYEAHYGEPSTFLRSQLSSTPDPAGYANPDYDALLEAARHTIEPGKKAKLYEEAERLLARDMPFIPLIHSNNVQLVKPHVLGYRPNALTYLYSKDLSIGTPEHENRLEQ